MKGKLNRQQVGLGKSEQQERLALRARLVPPGEVGEVEERTAEVLRRLHLARLFPMYWDSDFRPIIRAALEAAKEGK